jgi:site-specific DNA-methyltransferase (cytosine-N4-specific)
MMHLADCRDVLPALPAKSVQMCVTSPPYWALRDYGTAGQLGIEKTPEEYVAKLVDVFRDVRRVLRDDGTLWLNLGDTFINAKGRAHGTDPKNGARRFGLRPNDVMVPGYKRKDLVGIPWMAAFALRADGWYLRSDIVWEKPDATPDPVRDRPQRAHEIIFLLSKSVRYAAADFEEKSVWKMPVNRRRGVQTGTFPDELPRRCIAYGSRPGDTVLDPFAGSGTTGRVAESMGRHAVCITLPPAVI